MSADRIGPLVRSIAWHLDGQNGAEEGELSMQILKMAEEYGEVVRAWIGYTGQNPRKGVTHTLDDVQEELADVAITALVGIARLGGDPAATLLAKLVAVADRYGLEVPDGE